MAVCSERKHAHHLNFAATSTPVFVLACDYLRVTAWKSRRSFTRWKEDGVAGFLVPVPNVSFTYSPSC